jgi:hypothetical protein
MPFSKAVSLSPSKCLSQSAPCMQLIRYLRRDREMEEGERSPILAMSDKVLRRDATARHDERGRETYLICQVK